MRRHPVIAAAGGGPGAERGIVVLIALIVMVALSLAAVGLMRSVDTTSMIAGNIAFRQSAQSISSSAVERALYDMIQPSGTIDVTTSDSTKNYYAVWQNSDDPFGVPAVLRGNPPDAYPASFQKLNDQVGNTAYYVIERMCLPPALSPPGIDMNGQKPDPRYCEMLPPKQSSGTTANKPIGIRLPAIPYYRVTFRVDGPNNAVSFGQAMIR
jgi:type IV pilus assembly protein PilX